MMIEQYKKVIAQERQFENVSVLFLINDEAIADFCNGKITADELYEIRKMIVGL